MDSTKPVTLMKALEDWTEEELKSLWTEDGKGWDLVSTSHDDIKEIRARLVEDVFTHVPRNDLITAINWSEEMRLMTTIMLRIGMNNREAIEKYMQSGRCAFCEWKYLDTAFTVPEERVLTKEELVEVNARICAQIIEHIKVCEKHPTRAIEKAIDRALEIIETGDLRLLAQDGPAGGQVPELSLEEWKELYSVLHRARNVE